MRRLTISAHLFLHLCELGVVLFRVVAVNVPITGARSRIDRTFAFLEAAWWCFGGILGTLSNEHTSTYLFITHPIHRSFFDLTLRC